MSVIANGLFASPVEVVFALILLRFFFSLHKKALALLGLLISHYLLMVDFKSKNLSINQIIYCHFCVLSIKHIK
jgi:hypothetical protein